MTSWSLRGKEVTRSLRYWQSSILVTHSLMISCFSSSMFEGWQSATVL